MRTFSAMALRRSTTLTIALLGLSVVGCGSSKTSTVAPNAPRSPGEQTEPKIKAMWAEFFSPSTPAATKESLLQNGTQFAPIIQAQATSPLAKQSSAKVSEVKLTNTTTAKVTYTISLAGHPVLKNASGTAVKSGGNWVVSDASFCQLLRLEGSAPPACPKG